MINDHNPNVYWEVDGERYYRKTEALVASAQNNNSHVTFNYYNDAFSKYNWLIEPTETFEELAAMRAHQLRDSNRYIRLWYSGGADSHTMLRTFIDNNIHIDEIVAVRSSPINDFNGRANREANLRSIPYLKSIQCMIPKTKISMVDISAEQYLRYYKTENWHHDAIAFSFSDDPGTLLGSREAIEQFSQLKIHPGGVEVAGGDKPKIIRRDGIYYTTIVDSAFHYLYWANAKEFYTTAEFPMLHSKQCHEMKHILERWYPKDQDITSDIYNPLTIDPEFKKEWYHCCRQIINYKVDLGKGWRLLSPKTQLRWNDAVDKHPELIKYFVGALQELQPKIQHYWKDFDGMITGVVADSYSLGPYNSGKNSK